MTALVCALLLSAGPKTDPALVGTWLLLDHPFLTLTGNGKGQMDEDAITWSADGTTLTVRGPEGDSDQGRYQVQGDVLTLTLGGTALVLQRKGGATPKAPGPLERAAAKATAPAPAGAPPGAAAQVPKAAGADPMTKLLLSSAWCSFSYNKVSGTTRTERFVFSPNGTWSNAARGETYNSGPNGSVAGQHDSGGGGRWEVRGGVVWMSEGDGPLAPVPGSVTTNSNGYPIITSNGREYSSCN
ncbi:MAG: hypothetical protein K1X89_15305 [Myxococcaceae bacterium]|nr:hypothetical protein [Myxococcaceae bacterium]